MNAMALVFGRFCIKRNTTFRWFQNSVQCNVDGYRSSISETQELNASTAKHYRSKRAYNLQKVHILNIRLNRIMKWHKGNVSANPTNTTHAWQHWTKTTILEYCSNYKQCDRQQKRGDKTNKKIISAQRRSPAKSNKHQVLEMFSYGAHLKPPNWYLL